jgi:PUA domain protein
MKKMVVDKGGISRVITGANVMCPGLTSSGGYVTEGLKEGTIVAVYGEGKYHPFAIGKMLMSS